MEAKDFKDDIKKMIFSLLCNDNFNTTIKSLQLDKVTISDLEEITFEELLLIYEKILILSELESVKELDIMNESLYSFFKELSLADKVLSKVDIHSLRTTSKTMINN